MDQKSEVNYYQRREKRARFLADSSSDGQIRRIHTEMANQYAEKVRELTAKPILTIVAGD